MMNLMKSSHRSVEEWCARSSDFRDCNNFDLVSELARDHEAKVAMGLGIWVVVDRCYHGCFFSDEL